MRIRMITQPTGLLNGVPWPAIGTEMELPDVVAVDLLNAGSAEPVIETKVETATPKPKAETRRKKV